MLDDEIRKYNWQTVLDAIDDKSENILQFVSKCVTPSRREKYVEQLDKYIKVDQYGYCSRDVHRRDNRGGCENDECSLNERRIIPKYRFYLAFENSICK